MQLQFEKERHSCLQPVKREVQTHEETQEVRLPDDMPDVGSVLGSWGQVLMRGKEWRSGSMQMTGGVMAWVLYMPEAGGVPQKVEVWLPFQLRWDLPDTKNDGKILIRSLLRSVDARTTSARKLMVRATVSVLAEAMVEDEIELPQPGNVPEDVYLYKRSIPVQLPVEAGEKAFHLTEELTLPGSCPQMKTLMRFGLQPELIDRKVMSDKVVFRGSALVHILYLSQEDALCAWDFEVPFSQYAELDKEYSADATAQICMALTGLELEEDPEGRLQLKAAVTGQYVIYDKVDMELVEDAYSNCRTVTTQMDKRILPVILDSERQTLHAEESIALEGGKVVDTAVYAAWPEVQKGEGAAKIAMTGHVQVLTCDETGVPRENRVRWEVTREQPLPKGAAIEAAAALSGMPQVAMQPGNVTVGCDLLLESQTVMQQETSVATGLELGEMTQPDPNRPGVILRRSGGESLWQIAKSCGSDVDTIRAVNNLTDEPTPDTMLLIPIS